MLTCCLSVAARVFGNGPLRAKEASPFLSSKYPVIVRHPSKHLHAASDEEEGID